MKTNWVIAVRNNKLSIGQAKFVKSILLQHYPQLTIQIKIIKTLGDRKRKINEEDIEEGIFTKEIEDALSHQEVDLAIHHLKDVPINLQNGLVIGAVPIRDDPKDVLVSKDNVLFENLPSNANVGTRGLYRKVQLLKLRPDIQIVENSGNVNTHIQKVYAGILDAVIVSKAEMIRLGMEEWITQEFSLDELLPAVGQGAVAVELRSDDKEANTLLNAIRDGELLRSVLTERAFAKSVLEQYRIPIAAYAEVQKESIFFRGMIASLDGRTMIRREYSMPREKNELLSQEFAQTMMDEIKEFL